MKLFKTNDVLWFNHGLASCKSSSLTTSIKFLLANNNFKCIPFSKLNYCHYPHNSQAFVFTSVLTETIYRLYKPSYIKSRNSLVLPRGTHKHVNGSPSTQRTNEQSTLNIRPVVAVRPQELLAKLRSVRARSKLPTQQQKTVTSPMQRKVLSCVTRHQEFIQYRRTILNTTCTVRISISFFLQSKFVIICCF